MLIIISLICLFIIFKIFIELFNKKKTNTKNVEKKKTGVLKNTIMLYLLNIAKLVLPMLTLPYLTRVLSKDVYGIVAYEKSVMQYMQVIIDFGFMLSGVKAIALIKENKEKLNKEVSNILYARITLSLICMVILGGLTIFIPILNGNILYTFLAFLNIFLSCFLFDYYFRGIEKMEVVTVRFLIMKLISTVLTFLLVRSDKDILLIPILDIISSLITIIMVIFVLRKDNVKLTKFSFKETWIKLKESFIFFISNFSTTAFTGLHTLIIGIVLSKTDVAYWSVCFQCVVAVEALYTPLTDGIYPYMVKHKDFKLVKRTIKIYLPLIVIGCIFTFFVSKYALFILGGEDYMQAENVLRCLMPVLFFAFFALLFGWPVLGPIEKQNQITITTISAALFQIIGLLVLILINQFNLITVALLRSAGEFVLFILRFFFFLKYRKEYKTKGVQYGN